MKLLNRTAGTYFSVSLLMLLVSTPIFYLVLHRLFVDEADETLLYRRAFVVARLGQITTNLEITNWTRFEDDIDVLPLPTGRPPLRDTIYDGVAGKDDYSRELVTQETIHGEPYRLIIRSSMLENDDLIRTIVVWQVLMLSALLLCLLLINRWIAGRIWQPFYDTLTRLRAYDIRQRNQPQFTATTVAEFRELNEVLNKMTATIREDFISLKQFTENASHEIQTPLAIIRSKLDVMIQEDGLTDEQLGSVQSIYEATSRLSKLNQALLLLTKIENDQFAASERLNLKVLTEETLVLFEDFIQSKQLGVQTQLTDGWVEMNPTLARMLLTNLLGNAIRHNHWQGTLHVRLAGSTLSVSNSGEAPAFAPELLFERFRKSNPQSDSLGLGLAIVREICLYSQLGIEYTFKNGTHTVRVVFRG